MGRPLAPSTASQLAQVALGSFQAEDVVTSILRNQGTELMPIKLELSFLFGHRLDDNLWTHNEQNIFTNSRLNFFGHRPRALK